MKEYTVKDLMVPLSEYATVSDDATLYQAVQSLEKAQQNYDRSRYLHRAILVLDKNQRVVGKISQLDVLKALEPKYNDMLKGDGMHRFGFSNNFMKSILKDYHLFESPMKDICQKAGQANVKFFMSKPSEGEYVQANATLDIAIHQFVLGHHQSLLVTEQSEIIGILRLSDVFSKVYNAMSECYETDSPER